MLILVHIISVKFFWLIWLISNFVLATAGKFLKRLSNGQRLGTITGLDPAGVCTTYDGQKKKRCLKFEDANLVRILHSDSLYFGTEEAIGHYDIFLNGGHFQPQCFPHASALLNPEGKKVNFLINLIKFADGILMFF